MAVKGGEVLGDAALGASGGAALGPWGAAAGGVLGAGYGLIKGLFGGSSPSAAPPNPANFQLGQGNGSNYTNEIAGALANRGNTADATATGLQGQAAGAYGAAAAAQGNSAPQIQQDAADRQRQLAALGGTNASAANLTGSANALQAMGTTPMGPSYAAAQLQQGENANMNQALALAHSGRTLGGGASALQQAQFQNAQGGQVLNQQQAIARIQEQNQYDQWQLGALGAAQQGYGAAGGLYGQAGNQAGAVNQTDLGVQQTNAGLQQQQSGINNQTSATFGNIGQGLNASALGYGQLGLNYQGQGIGVLGQQLTANEALGGANISQGNLNMQNQINQNTANNAMFSTGMQSLAQIARNADSSGPTPTGNAQGASGQSLPPTTPAPAPDFGSGGPVPSDGTASDENVKTGIQPANIAMALRPQRAPTPLSAAPPPVRLSVGQATPVSARAVAPGPNDLASRLALAQSLLPAPVDPNAMPSGAPSRYTPQLAPGMSTSLAALGGGQAGGANDGPAAPQLPAGATGGDPYLAAIAGAGNRYLPNGYWDPTVVMPKAPTAAPAPASTLIPNPLGQLAPIKKFPDAAWQNPLIHSDAHSKTRIAQLESQLAALSPQQPDTSALDAAYRSQGGTPVAPPAVDLRPAQGYSYEYKDPAAHGQGRFFGPMAQDLEQTPAGASTVKHAPDGTKMVDTSRLSLVNTSAISEQQRKLEAMQRQLAALSLPDMNAIQHAQPGTYPVPQQPGAMDFQAAMRAGGTY